MNEFIGGLIVFVVLAGPSSICLILIASYAERDNLKKIIVTLAQRERMQRLEYEAYLTHADKFKKRDLPIPEEILKKCNELAKNTGYRKDLALAQKTFDQWTWRSKIPEHLKSYCPHLTFGP